MTSGSVIAPILWGALAFPVSLGVSFALTRAGAIPIDPHGTAEIMILVIYAPVLEEHAKIMPWILAWNHARATIGALAGLSFAIIETAWQMHQLASQLDAGTSAKVLLARVALTLPLHAAASAIALRGIGRAAGVGEIRVVWTHGLGPAIMLHGAFNAALRAVAT